MGRTAGIRLLITDKVWVGTGPREVMEVNGQVAALSH